LECLTFVEERRLKRKSRLLRAIPHAFLAIALAIVILDMAHWDKQAMYVILGVAGIVFIFVLGYVFRAGRQQTLQIGPEALWIDEPYCERVAWDTVREVVIRTNIRGEPRKIGVHAPDIMEVLRLADFKEMPEILNVLRAHIPSSATVHIRADRLPWDKAWFIALYTAAWTLVFLGLFYSIAANGLHRLAFGLLGWFAVILERTPGFRDPVASQKAQRASIWILGVHALVLLVVLLWLFARS
jgi:hypothetical protein